MIGDSKPTFRVEQARPGDIATLAAIERAAAGLFAGWQVPRSVLEEETPLETFREAQQDGLLWVARTDAGVVAGFALVMLVDGQPHLEEIDVHPAHGRQGIGRALVDAVSAWAGAAGHAALTLTTFKDVPWNAPFYARAGFRALDPSEVSPALAAVVKAETARGLDPAGRVVMRRDLHARSPR